MEWNEMLPYLAQQIEEGNVWQYDVHGFTRKVTEEQIRKIKEIESEFKETKVVAVLDAKYRFTDCEIDFNTYLLLSDDSIPIVGNDGTIDYVSFLAFVDNLDDSECSEMGEVGMIEISGLLKRIY